MSAFEIKLFNTIKYVALISIFVLIDAYAWVGVKDFITTGSWFAYLRLLYLASSIITVFGIGFTIGLFIKGEGYQGRFLNIFMGLVFIIVFPKLLFDGFLIIEDLYRFLLLAFRFLHDIHHPILLIARPRLISGIGLVVSGILLLFMAEGVFGNKYNYRVKQVTLFFENLPKAFDGYKLVHISDIHSGSFDKNEKIERGINIINTLKPDLILFSGDMVNMRANEFAPFIPTFAKLKASDGMFSVLGNHDYGDNVKFKSTNEKWRNINKLISYERRAGFTVLLDEHVAIKRGDDALYIAGVENWGHRPFPKRGNLTKAIASIPHGGFIILLSHDPSHWDSIITEQAWHIPLTLSGHTHGMQFGIDLPWFRWSPVKWKYPFWAGLYKKNGMCLYVNIGFGFIGLPGRIGMLPEITNITLKRKG